MSLSASGWKETLRQSEARYRTISDLISDYAYAVRIEPDDRPDKKLGSGLELSVSTGIAQAWPAPLRLAYPGAPYHVIARGNARQASSTEDQTQQRFLAARTEGVTRARWLCPAYCLKDPPLTPAP